MKTEQIYIPVKEIVQDFKDDGEGGVVGYGGKLDIRPQYQREFIYGEAKRDAVIRTVTKNLPLNGMYWNIKEDRNYEVIDGQQRTISISQYVHGDFPFNGRYFQNLHKNEREEILNYRCQVHLCSGTDSERLEWFQAVNTVGDSLSLQENRNAVFSGDWVTSAKEYFSRTGCPAYEIGKEYIKGAPIRQDYLETALKWISKDPSTPYTSIEDYMGCHQHDENAEPLWNYYQSVINWISSTFTVKLEQMKKVDWGYLYSRYKDDDLDSDSLAAETQSLLLDDDVQNLAGIYPYLLTRDQRHLNIRAFTLAMKTKVYAKQKGRCALSGEECRMAEMEADHIIPWSEGGKTTEDNCRLLSAAAHREVTAAQLRKT